MKIDEANTLLRDSRRITFSSIIKILLIILLFCGSPFLLINTLKFIDSVTTTITPSYSDCTKNISENKTIKISAHREKSILGIKGSKVFIFWITTDKQETWKEFMRFFPDDPPQVPSCKNIKILDENNYWVWEGWQLAITHDGGNSWIFWEPKISFPNQRCCSFDVINNVQFESATNGWMALDFEKTGESLTIVQTIDGGKTWK